MENKKVKLLRVDMKDDGGVKPKIYNRKDDDTIESIEEETVRQYETTDPIPKDDDKLVFKVKAFSGSPLKVYIDTKSKVYCYKVDPKTGKILGPC